MYEVDFKVELTDIERQKLIEAFKQSKFVSQGVTPQHDVYIEATQSPHGGFDLKRYRNENGEYMYTEKIWEIIEGQPFRKENQHEVSKEEFDSNVAKFPNAITIKKDREWFEGSYQGIEISTIIDSVKFDHSPAMRYFVEAEIDVVDKKDVVETKELIKDFLKEVLGKSELIEAPGMFSMAFKKL